MRSYLLPLLLAAAASFVSSGCVKKVLTEGQIQGTRQASTAVDSIPDYELGRGASYAGLAQFEGMHQILPGNTDALYLLAKTWTGYSFGFLEDDMQVAQDAGDDDGFEYNKKRARSGYDRAVFYGMQLLCQKAPGYEQAKRNELSFDKWLKENFTDKDDAANLLWTGQAWLSRVNVMKGDDDEGPAFIADLWIGVAMLERAVAIDPSAEHYSGFVALGAYHARTALAELDEAKKDFEVAMSNTQGRALLAQFTFATSYACQKGDAALYQSTLNAVLQAQDPDPELRLANAIAKRRAKRWLGKRRVKEQCGFDLASAK